MARGTKKTNGKNQTGANLGFEETLWAIADKLRGQMDSAEYKHVVLGLIFLKYISDGFEAGERQLELWPSEPPENLFFKEKGSEEITNNLFKIPKEAQWSYLQANVRKQNIGEVIDEAMELVERENPSLKGILPKNYSRSSLDGRRLGELVELIGTIALGDEESRAKDILGRVYEYFLGRFASVEGKGGEFYTPQSVVKLLVEMTEPYKGCVYDPCCGSGGLFVQSRKFVQARGGQANDLSIYGQESNPTTWRLCQINLAMRGIKGDIGARHADTLHEDLHEDLKADFILANPPFNQSDWGGDLLRNDARWKYGIPPAGNANFAWVQHIVHHLAPQGVAGFVLSNGSLSTNHGKAESQIRQNLIEADLIDCIVSLPGQLFYTTQIAACIWFIAKNKPDTKFRDRRGQTLFIYAGDFGKMIDRTHCELTDDEIARIASTYRAWRSKEDSSYRDIPGFCKSASLADIHAHKMSLVPGRYVGFDNSISENWEMSKLRAELAEVETRLREINKASEVALTVLKELLYG